MLAAAQAQEFEIFSGDKPTQIMAQSKFHVKVNQQIHFTPHETTACQNRFTRGPFNSMQTLLCTS